MSFLYQKSLIYLCIVIVINRKELVIYSLCTTSIKVIGVETLAPLLYNLPAQILNNQNYSSSVGSIDLSWSVGLHLLHTIILMLYFYLLNSIFTLFKKVNMIILEKKTYVPSLTCSPR